MAELAQATDFERFIEAQESKGLLRFITCGSVDDGKSTLIGRLLYDSKLIFEDQMASLESDSRRHGTVGEELDLALLVDGLQAEREQGITIDVAYRYFATDKRKFIVADTPGHEQYTRNMVTGASTAEAAVILVDARAGVLTQTRRHSFIVGLLGLGHVVLAVNKMDLVDWDQARFDAIVEEYAALARELKIDQMTAIPISALTGANVVNQTDAMPWYEGPTLLGHLETLEVGAQDDGRPFRFCVQWVNRPDADFRGYTGTVAAGAVRPGEEIVVLPSGRKSRITEIVTYDGVLEEAVAGQAVTLTLADEIDVVRGDVIAAAAAAPTISDQCAAHIIWMHDEPLLPGRQYLMRLGTTTVPVEVTDLKYAIDVNNFAHKAVKHLDLNEIAFCNIGFDHAVAFDPYDESHATGAFILIDRISNATVGAGMIRFALRRASNLVWQPFDMDKVARAKQKAQQPCVLWFTGLSGSGKSTIANIVEQKLHDLGRHTYVLDGDNVRHGLNKDLGFTDEDRVENIRRVAETAKLFVDAGLIVLVSFISPFRSERRMARERLDEGEFFEVFVDTPLEICEQRDPKGLYQKARDGKIANFTGISSPYEAPENAEITVETENDPAEDAAERIVAHLRVAGII